MSTLVSSLRAMTSDRPDTDHRSRSRERLPRRLSCEDVLDAVANGNFQWVRRFSRELCPEYSLDEGDFYGQRAVRRMSRDLLSEDKRRGGISFDPKEKNARYIRSGAEVKVLTKPELARGYPHHDRRHERQTYALQEHDLDKLENVSYRTRCGLRFLSLHRVRRRPRPALKCTKEHSSVLDIQYAGQAKTLLSTTGDWDFNIFTLNKLTNGRALFHVTLHLFQEHNLVEIFKLDIVKLMRFISLVEEGYHSSNPYHNAVHAADVAQAMHCYLQEPKLAKALSPLEKLGALVSAITHDVDHPGVNQGFLIATSNHLASLYNNSSVLENHHWRSAIALMHESGVFDHFSEALWKTIEWQIKSLILATDITRQQEFLARFKNHLDQKNLNLEDIEHKNFIMQIALKCADICNPCRTWDISKRWSELVCDEFFKQGDCERQLNLVVTPLCDRRATTVPKIQIGFLKFVVTPLFREWCRFNPTMLSENMLSNISTNHSNWERIGLEAETMKPPEQETLHEEEEEDEEETPISLPSIRTTTVIIEPRRGSLDDKENMAPRSASPEVVTTAPEPVPEVTDTQEEDDTMDEDSIMALNLYRRHSLPPPHLASRDGFSLPHRRESFPRSLSRRYSLPVSALPNSNSFDKLVEKLASLVECSPTNGTHFDYDQRPSREVSLDHSPDVKTLTNAAQEATKQTSAHGLDPLPLSHRQYTSEPHIALLAQHYSLTHRHGSLAHIARNLSVAGLLPRFQSSGTHRGSVPSATVSPAPQNVKSSMSQPSLPMSVDPSSRLKPATESKPSPKFGSSGGQHAPNIPIRGPRRSLGDTSSHLSRRVGLEDHRPHAAHSVENICPSGVNTADVHTAESSNHTSRRLSESVNHTSLSNNHKTVTVESLDMVSMTTAKHHSSSEEETPLLRDRQTFIETSDIGRVEASSSHANDSFTH